MLSTPNENIENVCDKPFCVYFGAGEETFVNPTVDEPVRTEEIMKHMNLSFLRPILDELYEEAWRFHFDPLAVLKTMIYWRLKGHRFLTDVFNDLLTDPTLADTLGYGFIPSYQQLYHFITYRINSKGTKKIFDKLLQKVIFGCEQRDIPIWREIVVDSSPFEKKNNDDATYSGHYGVTGYKWHNVRCAKTDIPLEYHVSTVTDYDGDFLVPLVYRMQMIHGLHPRRMFA